MIQYNRMHLSEKEKLSSQHNINAPSKPTAVSERTLTQHRAEPTDCHSTSTNTAVCAFRAIVLNSSPGFDNPNPNPVLSVDAYLPAACIHSRSL